MNVNHASRLFTELGQGGLVTIYRVEHSDRDLISELLEELRDLGYEGLARTLRRYVGRRGVKPQKRRFFESFEMPPGRQARLDLLLLHAAIFNIKGDRHRVRRRRKIPTGGSHWGKVIASLDK